VCRQHVPQVVFGDVKGEIADVQFGVHNETPQLSHCVSRGVPDARVSNQQ
jgi:hypothetical protein